MSLGTGSGGSEADSAFKPDLTDILDFIKQCRQCGQTEVHYDSLVFPVFHRNGLHNYYETSFVNCQFLNVTNLELLPPIRILEGI